MASEVELGDLKDKHVDGAPHATQSEEEALTPEEREYIALMQQNPKPIELDQDENDENFEERANCCSVLLFTYLFPLVRLGYRRPLVFDDLPSVRISSHPPNLRLLHRYQDKLHVFTILSSVYSLSLSALLLLSALTARKEPKRTPHRAEH